MIILSLYKIYKQDLKILKERYSNNKISEEAYLERVSGIKLKVGLIIDQIKDIYHQEIIKKYESIITSCNKILGETAENENAKSIKKQTNLDLF